MKTYANFEGAKAAVPAAALYAIQPDGTCVVYEDGDELPAFPSVDELVPQEVTMRQARLALLASGKLAAVEAAIDALPEPQRTAARIEWEYSGAVRRRQPLVLALAPGLGMTDQDVDQLFKVAEGL